MASYRCLICNEDILPDHDCLHIDISDFSTGMELLSISYESIAESKEYAVSLVSEAAFGEGVFTRKPVPVFLRM